MVKADFVASFIGHEAGKALFIGLYRRGQWRPLTLDEYWRLPANIEMRALECADFKGTGNPFFGSTLRRPHFIKIGKAALLSIGRRQSVRGGAGRTGTASLFLPYISKAFSTQPCRDGMSYDLHGTS